MSDLFFALIIPAVVALSIVGCIAGIMGGELARRVSAPAALALAFIAGFWLIPSQTSWWPTRHWHWLPYCGVMAAAIGLLPMSTFKQRILAGIAVLVAISVASWLLVPRWPELWPSRPVMIVMLISYLSLLTFGLQWAGSHRPAWHFATLLSATSLLVAVCVALAVSTTFARMAAIISGSLFGIAAGSAWFRFPVGGLVCLVPCYSVLLGGTAMVGAVEPDPPLFELMLAAAAPLGLVVVSICNACHEDGWKSKVVDGVTLILPLLAVMGWLAWKFRDSGADGW